MDSEMMFLGNNNDLGLDTRDAYGSGSSESLVTATVVIIIVVTTLIPAGPVY